MRLTGHAVERGDKGYQVAFADAESETRHYAVAAGPGLLAPSRLRPAAPSITPPAEGADYIVIAHPSLLVAVQPLVAWRQKQGLRTSVVTTEQIADQFGQGISSPDAIRAFLSWAAEAWPAPAPRFVLLAGDASYDPTGNGDGSQSDLTPTALVATQEMGETASDNALADLDGDGRPDLAIGRLPGQTSQEMEAMVAKTLAYEQQAPPGDWRQRFLFLADDDDPYFADFNREIADGLGAGLQAEQLVIGQTPDVREALLRRLNEGAAIVNYMGHGAVDIWAQEEVLTNDDIANLRQDGRLPFVVVWACLSGYFIHPEQRSLGEVLLLTPARGAVAALVPSGETYPTDQHTLAKALFGQPLKTEATIGEALLAAMRDLDPTQPGERDIINTFVLLGDPALRLVLPSPPNHPTSTGS